MAIIELKVPSPGESITEVIIAKWVKQSGDVVEKDEVLAEIDSDKATLTLNAEESGKIELLAAEGITDLSGYAYTPGMKDSELFMDFFVD